MTEINWTCPYCNSHQTIVGSKIDSGSLDLTVGDSKLGRFGIWSRSIGCSNPTCKEVDVLVQIFSAKHQDRQLKFEYGTLISEHKLKPEYHSNVQPDYVPAVLVRDYEEACRIRDLSPKASATLARRCIQGIIRNFCGITINRLIDEIKELRAAIEKGFAPSGVTSESVDAIDHVRQIGNIGAHMEKDINLIVDVDPGEAQALIELIELLFEE